MNGARGRRKSKNKNEGERDGGAAAATASTDPRAKSLAEFSFFIVCWNFSPFHITALSCAPRSSHFFIYLFRTLLSHPFIRSNRAFHRYFCRALSHFSYLFLLVLRKHFICECIRIRSACIFKAIASSPPSSSSSASASERRRTASVHVEFILCT